MALSLVAAGSPDVLSNAIQFDLPATASYIVGRSNTTWLPLGSATYTPDQGTRLLRFVISDTRGFLDPSSVVLSFRLLNTGSTGNLRFRDTPITIFRRIKVFCSGTLVEDITEAQRLATFMRMCEPKERLENEKILSNWTERDASGRNGAGIPPGQARRVYTDLRLLGLFRISKHLPISHMAITLEFELADGADIFYASMPATATLARAAVVHSQSYALQDVQIQGDMVELSPELLSRYTSLLDQGKHFPITFTTWTNSRHVLLQVSDQDVATTRALSLLKTAFISFTHTNFAWDETSISSGFNGSYGPWNLFLNPVYQVAHQWTDTNDHFNWELQIGGRHWPSHVVRGAGAETYYHFRQALDMAVWGQSSFNTAEWNTLKWVAGIDLERGSGSLDNLSMTGTSTRSGEPIVFKLRGFDTAVMPNTAFIHLCHDAILTVSKGGCEVSV